MSRRVRLVAASILTAMVLTFGPVVFTPEVEGTGPTGEHSMQYVSASVSAQYGILPARLRVWQN